MKYMPKEVQDELKLDIKNGKIWGLKLIKTPIHTVERNVYAQIFDCPREIVGFDDNCFYLKTRRCEPHYLEGTYNPVSYYESDFSIPDDIYEECEAYYQAFNYYDGNILKSITEIGNPVNETDRIQETVYEVIRSY